VEPGDILITLGAGSVWRVGDAFLKGPNGRHKPAGRLVRSRSGAAPKGPDAPGAALGPHPPRGERCERDLGGRERARTASGGAAARSGMRTDVSERTVQGWPRTSAWVPRDEPLSRHDDGRGRSRLRSSSCPRRRRWPSCVRCRAHRSPSVSSERGAT
jgi:hypothetical protein